MRSMQLRLRIQTLALLLAACVSPSVMGAEPDDELVELMRPDSSVSAGIIFVDDDNSRFGQYRGLTDDGLYGKLDLNFVTRDDATGTWLFLTGRDLGLDSRELRFEQQRQGDWQYFFEYSQTPRVEPYTVNTGLAGIGSNDLVINGTSLRDVELETQRKAVGIGGKKHLWGDYAFQVSFKNEEKDGERLFGRGTTGGPGNFEFLAEPIDSTTRQWEAILSYTGDRLQWAAGYYGTQYDNANSALNITGGAAALAGFTPIALPPDNQSHQGYLSGSYSFTPATVGNFKVAYARATQNDSFIVASAPGNGDLDGRVDTTQAALGLRSRPTPELTLRANVRYEDRDDKTPIRIYYTGPGTTTNGENEPRSIETTAAKLEASYLLPKNYRLTGSVDYEKKERSEAPIRVVSHRDETEELTYRVELRRSLSDTLNGAVSLVHAERDGSKFLTTVRTTNAPYSNEVAPIHLADRDRNQIRLLLDWMPMELLSVQFVADSAWDDYDQRTANELGPLKGSAQHFSVDASYAISDELQATAWYAFDINKAEQAADEGGRWVGKFRDTGHAVGLGLTGSPTSRIDMGADLQFDYYKSRIDQDSSAAVAPEIPDVTFRRATLGLFAKYRIDKQSGVRVDFTHERIKTNDWSWSTWTYSDGTVLREEPRQNVSFVALSYFYKFM